MHGKRWFVLGLVIPLLLGAGLTVSNRLGLLTFTDTDAVVIDTAGQATFRTGTGRLSYFDVVAGVEKSVSVPAIELAQSTATTGVTNAATAQGTANTALADAATGIANAATAQGTANTALANAATADGKAVAAQGTANTALADAATGIANAATAQSTADAAVPKALYDANSILIATSDNTPLALTVGASTIVGRGAAGDIVAMSVATTQSLLNVEDGADVTDATNVDAAGAVMNSDFATNGSMERTGAGTYAVRSYESAPDGTLGDAGFVCVLDAAGLLDGRDPSADGTKLDGVEALADVTDATNVDAAGAVMNSDYDANSILAATADNTPLMLTVGASTFVGRGAAGDIAAMSVATSQSLLGVDTLITAGASTVFDADFGADGLLERSGGAGVYTTRAAVTTSAGAGDSGKVPALNASGVLDPSITDNPLLDADFACASGYLRKTGAGTYVCDVAQMAAAVAPTVNEDSGDGYGVGSIWLDTTADLPYLCLDASVGAAVWVALGGTTSPWTSEVGPPAEVLADAEVATINDDAAAGSDQNPRYCMLGGDGGAEVISTCLELDSSDDKVYLYTALDGTAVGQVDRNQHFYIGPRVASDRSGIVTLHVQAESITGAGTLLNTQWSVANDGHMTVTNSNSGGAINLTTSSGNVGVTGTMSVSSTIQATAGTINLWSDANQTVGSDGTHTNLTTTEGTGFDILKTSGCTNTACGVQTQNGSSQVTSRIYGNGSGSENGALFIGGTDAANAGGGGLSSNTAWIEKSDGLSYQIPYASNAQTIRLVYCNHGTSQPLVLPDATGTSGRCVHIKAKHSVGNCSVTSAGAGDAIDEVDDATPYVIAAGTDRAFHDNANNNWESLGSCP